MVAFAHWSIPIILLLTSLVGVGEGITLSSRIIIITTSPLSLSRSIHIMICLLNCELLDQALFISTCKYNEHKRRIWKSGGLFCEDDIGSTTSTHTSQLFSPSDLDPPPEKCQSSPRRLRNLQVRILRVMGNIRVVN